MTLGSNGADATPLAWNRVAAWQNDRSPGKRRHRMGLGECKHVVDKIVYFEEMGVVNTDVTLALAREKAEAKGIECVLIASHTGFTAVKAMATFQGTDVKLVFVGSGRNRFSAEILQKIEAKGCPIIFSDEADTDYWPEIVDTVLKRFCEGMTVTIYIMMMAVHEEIIPTHRPIISVAGTGPFRFEQGGGADTAIVVNPCTAEHFFKQTYYKHDRRLIREILCKPW